MEPDNLSFTRGDQGIGRDYGPFLASAQHQPADLLYFPRRIQRFTLPLQGLEARLCCSSRYATAFLAQDLLNRLHLPLSLDAIFSHTM
jgi:hypothetical protein